MTTHTEQAQLSRQTTQESLLIALLVIIAAGVELLR